MNLGKCKLTIWGEGYPNMLIGSPIFFWKVEGATGKQISYEIAVCTLDHKAFWNSGTVESSHSAGVTYKGSQFQSNCHYYAFVRVQDEQGTSYVSEKVFFQTGLMSVETEWKAAWLTSPHVAASSQIFRKQFEVKEDVKRARLFICGLGYYELYINGFRIGDRYMDPAWTDYNKRVNYVAYDVKEWIKTGNNAIGVALGFGWFTNAQGLPRPVVTLQLIVEYTNGNVEYITTQQDGTWHCLKESWILENTIYIGEKVDGRKIIKNWSSTDFNYEKGNWAAAILGNPPAGKLCPMAVEPIRCIKEISPSSITKLGTESYIVDFAQNIAGIVELKMHNLPEGTEVKIRFSEILSPDGTLNTENLRDGQACDIYIASGEPEEVYRPSFTYHGFRYAEVSGQLSLNKNDIKALVMRSDVKVRSSFTTSNPLINDIQRICHWTENNNLHSVPTDCPQRDERLGWLNDLTVRMEEAMFNFDLHAFLRKFLTDIKDEQSSTGAITDTVPYLRFGNCPADPVSTSYLLLPWMLWKHYGDTEVLNYAWDGIKAWVDYLANCRDKNGIVGYSYYGDWAAPIAGSVRFSHGNGAVSAITPGGLMSTGFLYMNALLLSEIAEQLRKAEEVQCYTQLASETKNALNTVYLNREQGYYASNSQAANVFMLYLNIVPEEFKQSVLNNLIKNIREHDTHTTTGNICTRYIYDVLAENGEIDLAYELVTQTTYPSWGYMLAHGATTTWERWEYVDSGELVGMASHDHPMYSTISGWFYKYLAGIRPDENGFEHFTVKPFIPQKLEKISACVETVKGIVTVSISNVAKRVCVEITVPFNSICTYEITDKNATSILVDGIENFGAVTLASGFHTVEYNI